MADYNPLRGSSYIKLPRVITKKKAVINMKNEDNQCFNWCITRVLNPVKKNGERIDKILRIQSEKISWKGIKFPVELNDIKTFENKNGEIAVNVFGYEREIYPLRIHKGDAKKHIINLLLIADEGKKHYCLINNMRRLLSAQVSKHRKTKEVFLRCLNHFSTKEKLKIHEEYYSTNEAVKIKMSEKGIFIAFKNHYRFIIVPFNVYVDFECFVIPISMDVNQLKIRVLPITIKSMNLVGFVIVSNVLMTSYIP